MKPSVWLPPQQTIPVRNDEVFSQLSFTRNAEDGGSWIGPLRRSLQSIQSKDGELLNSLLDRQCRDPKDYDFDEEKYKRELKNRVRRADGAAIMTVPDDSNDTEAETSNRTSSRESFQIQAELCRIGEAMGRKIWLPPGDRSRVTVHWSPQPNVLLDHLPLNYDDNTIETIEYIDVLWLNGRSITRAFEVEHTTAIYSGMLRMADLCSLLPNINISLHIVAPEARREKVFKEIARPVFSLLEPSPLPERCTYISYGSIRELVELPHLPHTADSVLDEFAEFAM